MTKLHFYSERESIKESEGKLTLLLYHFSLTLFQSLGSHSFTLSLFHCHFHSVSVCQVLNGGSERVSWTFEPCEGNILDLDPLDMKMCSLWFFRKSVEFSPALPVSVSCHFLECERLSTTRVTLSLTLPRFLILALSLSLSHARCSLTFSRSLLSDSRTLNFSFSHTVSF